jgi:hypothetical protein
MSLSRSLTRLAAVAVTVPLLVVAAPVFPALADSPLSVETSAAPGQVVGPHAGYLGAGIGQNGTTEVFRISTSEDASISTVRVRLTGDSTQISIGRDFDSGDGFAFYADTDGVPGFGPQDKQIGLLSTGWAAEQTTNTGETPVRLTLPAAVTGHSLYYVTVHPAAVNFPTRQFTLRVDPNTITGSVSGPAAAVSTPTSPRIKIDSQAPGAPAKSFFTPVSRVAGVEDSYLVGRGVNPEPGASVAFYNNSNDPNLTSVLNRPDGSPVVSPVLPDSNTASSREIMIGDGTGATSTNPHARNNQRNNSVYVRLLDPVGNYSDATSLLIVYPSTDSDKTVRGNPVLGPTKPTSTTAANVNQLTQGNAPVKVGNPAAPTATTDDVTIGVKTYARMVQLGADGKQDLTKLTPWTTVDYSTTTSGTPASIPVDTRPSAGPPAYAGIAEGASAVGVAANLDNLGNFSDLLVSSPPLFKDTGNPVLSIVDTTRNGQAQPGDLVQVRFSEPMNKANISVVAVSSGTPGQDTERCDPGALPPSFLVQNQLPVKSPGGTPESWGWNACWNWNTDGTGGTIRVGDPVASSVPPPSSCDDNAATTTIPDCPALFSSNSVVLPAGTLAAPKVADIAGNQVRGLDALAGQVGSTTIASSTVFPISGSAVTRDENADGFLDSVDVTFTGPVDNSNFEDYAANLTAVGSSTTPITAVTYPTGAFDVLRFSFAPVFLTGERPQIRLTKPADGPTGMVTKEVTPREVRQFGVTPLDKAAPRPMSAVYVDTNKDGHIDSVSVTYSEPIAHANDNNATAAPSQGPGYRVPGYENLPASPQTPDHNSVSPTINLGTTKTITLTPKTAFDTGSPFISMSFTPATSASVMCTSPPCAPMDNATVANANVAANSYSRSVSDGAAPVIISRSTRDLDNDGKIDAIDVKFSEPISTPSVGTAVFSVAGHQLLSQFATAGDVVRLVIDELGDRTTGDTDAKPAVTYQGGVADTQGNVTAPDGATPPATTDGAGPAIMLACPSTPAPGNGICPAGDDGTKLFVKFSEPLSGAATMAKFVVEQPAGTTKTQSADPTMTAGNASATLNFAAGATSINKLADAFVRFATDGAVTDVATNPSHQTTPVTAFALPVVSLNIVCAVPANPGWCASTAVDSGATGTAGVSLWRLEETARGADSTYSTTQPSTLTLSEGTHTLYLSGKDDYGRLTNEATGTIKVLKPPTIQNVQWVDSTPSKSLAWSKTDTVLDGDNVQIGADAFGTDAADWASAPSGGDCNAAYLSIDLRDLLGNTAKGAVAPVNCDLKTNTAPPYRQLQWTGLTPSGTTRYPVGTVLKLTPNDPGYLVVDGPGGTQLRRPFISVNARRSWQITDASVIQVPVALLNGLKKGPAIAYRDGAIVKGTNTGYYYVSSNVKRPVTTASLASWKIPTSTAYAVTTPELAAMPTMGGVAGGGFHPVGVWVKLSNGSIQQIVRNASGTVVRRQVANAMALKTLVPSSQIFQANAKDTALPLDSFQRGYRDGTLLKVGTNYGVVARSSLRMFANAATFNSLGYATSNALSGNGAALPHVAGQAYRSGAAIDRYKITTIVVTVRNSAGSVATATVKPATGGIYGVGTFDAVPMGWDTSWS